MGINATIPGSGSNVPASSITQIVNGLSYPLFCLNGAPTSGGAAQESPTRTASRFAAAVAKTGLASPLAIADAAIGVSYTPTNETALYSAVWESGIVSGIAGFELLIDNGTGTASSGLIAAVSASIQATPQYRPAGVPWLVSGVIPVSASVGVSATLLPQYEGSNSQISSAITSGIQEYFSEIQFAQSVYQGAIAAAAGDSAPGLLSSLTVTLNTSASYLSAAPNQRIILNTISVSVS